MIFVKIVNETSPMTNFFSNTNKTSLNLLLSGAYLLYVIKGIQYPPCPQDVGRILKGSSKWKQVHNGGSKQTLSLSTTHLQVHLHYKHEALAVKDQSVDDVGVEPFTPEKLPRPERPTPHITTTSTRTKRWVIVL